MVDFKTLFEPSEELKWYLQLTADRPAPSGIFFRVQRLFQYIYDIRPRWWRRCSATSPLASFGFSRLPRPWNPRFCPRRRYCGISSMNRMILPSDFSTSLKTAFSLSSNSPPKLRAPRSKRPYPARKWSCPSDLPVRLRSKYAVPSPYNCGLPTPGSPISTDCSWFFWKGSESRDESQRHDR